jgi:hypothetical protein
MMLRHLRALLGVVLTLAWVNLGHAQSTINAGEPASDANLTSLVVRQQFQAAASDINGLLSKHAATSTSQCPATPYVGEDCLTMGATPYAWNIWTGGTAGWATFVTINPSTGLVTLPLNSSEIAGINPVSVTFPSGLATVSLNFNSSLVLDGSNNLGINYANPGTYTATQVFPNGSLTNAELANSTISGVALGGTLGGLTFGTHLAAGGTSYNGAAAVTITSDATNLNTASTIVARDGSGNFLAGTITAALTGHASLDLALSGLGTNVQTALGNTLNATGGLVGFSGSLGAASGTSLTLGGASLGGNILAVSGGSIFSGQVDVISSGTTALAVGQNGTTNPALGVDASTASSVTGLNIKSAAAGNGVSLTALSSNASDSLNINAKGSGSVNIANVSTANTDIGTGGGGLIVHNSFTATGLVTNADLANPSTTVNGQTCTLGSSCSPTAANINYTAPSGTARAESAKFFESTPSIVDWGGLGNNSQDNATAFNTALTNVTSGSFGAGVPYAITFPQGTFNFASKPNSDNLGVNFLGVSKSQTAIQKTYNEATATNGIISRVQSGGQAANGCRLENMTVEAGTGTTGGSGVSFIGAASPNGPDYCTMQDVVITYVGTGALSASGASLYIDGSAITTGALGIRDTKLINVEAFSNGWSAAFLKSVVDFQWTGGNIAGLAGDLLQITGTAGVPSTNVNIDISNIDSLSIDNTIGCHIHANQIVGTSVTIASTASGCMVFSDVAITGTITNNSTTSCVFSGKTVIGIGCPGVLGATLQTVLLTSPTGTTSATPVMMGFGSFCKITPVTTGRVRMGIRGALGNTSASITDSVQFRYGTGTAPANGAAASGTTVGGNIGVTSPAAASAVSAFPLEAVVTGLTVGTQIWFDASVFVNAGTSVMNAASCDATEF